MQAACEGIKCKVYRMEWSIKEFAHVIVFARNHSHLKYLGYCMIRDHKFMIKLCIYLLLTYPSSDKSCKLFSDYFVM